MTQKVSQRATPGLRPSVKPKAEDPYDVPWLDHPFNRKPRFEPAMPAPEPADARQRQEEQSAPREYE